MEALGVNIPGLIAQLINFTILLIILRAFVYKPVLRMLDERRRRIQGGLDAADRMRQEAAAADQQVQQRLDEARQEGQALIAQAQQIGSRVQDEARQQAQRESEQILVRARNEIQLERDTAITEIRRQFAELTIVAAERVIGQSLDRQAHRRLIDEVLSESDLRGNNGGGQTSSG